MVKVSADSVSVSIVQYAQPWHHQSPLLHRAAIAVNIIDSSKTIDMIDKIYANFDSFVDAAVEHKSRKDIADDLANLASSIGVDKEKFLTVILNDEVTQWLKYHTRHGRQLSVHVTPTIYVNGINFPDHSSSWTLEDWAKHIDPLLA